MIFDPQLNIDQTFASNADVTVHEAQMYDVLKIFSSHMIMHVLSPEGPFVCDISGKQRYTQRDSHTQALVRMSVNTVPARTPMHASIRTDSAVM